MSRRRPKYKDISKIRSSSGQFQLFCTGRGTHKKTHLAWVEVMDGLVDDFDRFPGEEPEPDHILFRINRDDSYGAGLADFAKQTINRETGDIYKGEYRHDPSDRFVRLRFMPSQLCDRCEIDLQVTEDFLVKMLRAADAVGVKRIDVSMMR